MSEMHDRLIRIEKKTDDITTQVANVREDVAGLKARSSIWGAIAGALTAIAAILLGGKGGN